MLEIVHDPFKLPHRVFLKCKSVLAAEKFLQAWIKEGFERGRRLRVVPEYTDNTLELSSRRSQDLASALRVMRDHFGAKFMVRTNDRAFMNRNHLL